LKDPDQIKASMDGEVHKYIPYKKDKVFTSFFIFTQLVYYFFDNTPGCTPVEASFTDKKIISF
jgi:hypothetical protein